MKTIRLMGWLFACLVAASLFTGCVTPQRAAFNSLAASGATVEKAMMLAADAKNLGKITQAQWNEISVKHAAWRYEFNRACGTAALDMSQLSFSAVTLLEKELIGLINICLKKP